MIGRIDTLALYSREGYKTANTLLCFVKLEYLQNGLGDNWVVKQTKMDETGAAIAYRTYDYTDSRLSKTQDYTLDGEWTGYTEYTYGDNVCIGKSYGQDGTLTGTVRTKTDWLGRLRQREYLDPQGDLISRKVYRYRFWELYRGVEGWTTVFILLVLTATMGIYINDDPITVRKKSREMAEKQKKE